MAGEMKRRGVLEQGGGGGAGGVRKGSRAETERYSAAGESKKTNRTNQRNKQKTKPSNGEAVTKHDYRNSDAE